MDKRLVAPNGRAKFIATVKGPLIVHDGEQVQFCEQGRLWFVGPWDRPVVLSSPPGRTVTIGIEFEPGGARHLVDPPLAQLRNMVVDARELGTHWLTMPGLADGDERTVQRHLVDVIGARYEQRDDQRWLAAWASAAIVATHGAVSIERLALESGYSRRMLHHVFERDVGLSPKALAQIVRFQTLYVAWARSGSPLAGPVESFADLSHLSREFKRFAGAAPARFASQANDFGRLFYM